MLLAMGVAMLLQGSEASTDTAGTVIHPVWTRRPTAAEFYGRYPASAKSRRIGGNTAIKCQITARGTLADCVVVLEDPVGEGFGEAAIKIGKYFRMKPFTWDKEPMPTSGGTIRIPIRFTPPR